MCRYQCLKGRGSTGLAAPDCASSLLSPLPFRGGGPGGEVLRPPGTVVLRATSPAPPAELSAAPARGTTQGRPAEDPSMPMNIGCPGCRKQLRLPESLVGQTCSCPSCRSTFTVLDQAGRVSVQPLLPDGSPEPLPEVVPVRRPGAPPPEAPGAAGPSAAAE